MTKNTKKQQDILNTIAALNQERIEIKNLVRIHAAEHKCHSKCDLAKDAKKTIREINKQVYDIGVESGLI